MVDAAELVRILRNMAMSEKDWGNGANSEFGAGLGIGTASGYNHSADMIERYLMGMTYEEQAKREESQNG